MKKSTISQALVAALAMGAGNVIADTVEISLTGNAAPGPFTSSILAVNNAAFTAGNTFRVMNNGAASGFGEKQIVSGNEVWTFDANTMTTATGGDMTPGVSMQSASGNAVIAAGNGLFDNAIFFGGAFGMLAPTAGSAAAAASGAGTLQNISGDNFEIKFPILHTQWGGSDSAFTLGEVEGGIVLSCTGYTSGTGHCTGDSLIDSSEDSAGFAGQYTQFDLDISVSVTAAPPEVPVPAAAWLFGSGLLGLVGVARRKKA